ncbi:hypothetical protein [Thalassoglobus polymorphus]|uniref:hypothetical protein n=1 Tax=Thalassoglobus polymorphus TaxID=2527994 RepID=UPI0018D2180E|nr:hypothetical protein [Thalassoglobus polymorphus]
MQTDYGIAFLGEISHEENVMNLRVFSSTSSTAYIGRFPVVAICLMMRIRKDFTNMNAT